MTWDNILKVKQDIKEPLDVPKLKALIKTLAEAKEEMTYIIRDNYYKLQETMSYEQFQKWQEKISKDTDVFKDELTEMIKRVYVMIETING